LKQRTRNDDRKDIANTRPTRLRGDDTEKSWKVRG